MLPYLNAYPAHGGILPDPGPALPLRRLRTRQDHLSTADLAFATLAGSTLAVVPNGKPRRNA